MTIMPDLYVMQDANGFVTCVQEWTPYLVLKEGGRVPLLAPIHVWHWKLHGDPQPQGITGRWTAEWKLDREFVWDGSLSWS